MIKNSIGSRIRLALVGSACIIAIVSLLILVTNQYNTLQNRQIIKTMTMEYSVYAQSEELIRLYNDVGKNPEILEYMTKYNDAHKKLTETFTQLKNTVVVKESKNLLLGLEHTVNQTIRETDTGLAEIKANNFQNFSEHFALAHKYNSFVLENTRSLLQKELEYLSTIQAQSERNYILSIYISAAIFFVVLLSILIYAQTFSQQLITPLSQLSLYAKDIADGNLKTDIKKQQLIYNDEIGSLTTSIYTMVDTLTNVITQEKQTSNAMKKTSESLREKNLELQKMNAIMIGRELKMVELKKEIEALKANVTVS